MIELATTILGNALGLLPELIDVTRELMVRAAVMDLIRILPL